MNKFFPLLLVIAACALLALEVSAGGDPLARICKGRSFGVGSFGEMFPVIESMKSSPQLEGCLEASRESVLDLEPIVMVDNVCTVDVAQRIGRYYAKYVSKKSKYYWTLSRTIRMYFLAAGVEISRLCQAALIEKLPEVSQERFSKDGLLMFKKFNKDHGELPKVVTSDDWPIENLFVVTKMDGILSDKQHVPISLASQTETETDLQELDRMKSLCRRELKPVYEKLFTPLVILTNVGFTYTSDTSESKRAKFRNQVNYRNWFSVTLLCESILDAETGAAAAAAANDEVHEFNLSAKLSKGLFPGLELIQKEVKSIGMKRRHAKGERKRVLNRLAKHVESILEAGSSSSLQESSFSKFATKVREAREEAENDGH